MDEQTVTGSCIGSRLCGSAGTQPSNGGANGGFPSGVNPFSGGGALIDPTPRPPRPALDSNDVGEAVGVDDEGGNIAINNESAENDITDVQVVIGRRPFRSPDILRALVPGQIAFDNFINADNFTDGAIFLGVGLTEQVLTVLTLGSGRAATAGANALSKPVQSGVIEEIVVFGSNANQIGHAFRHTDAIGLIRSDVQRAIVRHLAQNRHILRLGSNTRTVNVNGVDLTFNAHRLSNGTFNVGRITPPR